ncbi:sulfite exporter TauE/SafE family protein [Candidatus Woesearchaeota archaeon]|nr:sulfite exporter TauE/SafE family protein [Candidatus Woesearchaeota archaeon]
MKELKLHVSGMHCASCEVIIERKLKKVPNVKKVKVSRAKEEVKISYSDKINIEDLQKVISPHGYNLSQNKVKNKIDKKIYIEIAATLVIILGIYLLLSYFDILPKSFSVTDNMSYGFIFILGLIAATSTCLAVAGGLLLAVANKFNKENPNLTGWQKFKPHMYFNLGRIIGYVILGGLIGLLGSILTLSPRVTGIITILASLLMILIGIQLLGIFPFLNKIQFKMPKFIAHRIYDASSNKKSKSTKLKSFLFGASTFFLPCGFTQALQLYVLSQGSFTVGTLTMLAFSLGTLPSLVSVGALSSFLKGNLQRRFITFSAIVVILLGLFNIPNGFGLTGINIGSINSNPTGLIDNNVNIIDGKQIIDMKIVGLDYAPSNFKIIKGIPVEWRIDGTQAQGCAQVITSPKIGVTEYLPRDKIKTITFTPTELGKIPFSCTMGMTTYGAGFEVIENNIGLESDSLNLENNNEICDPESCEVQKLKMEVSRESGFAPNLFLIKKDIPVELEIDTKLVMGGCMSTLVIPDYDIAHKLDLGKTVLRFIPKKVGRSIFTCSMGSKIGEFIIE